MNNGQKAGKPRLVRESRFFNSLNYVILGLLALLMIYPFYNVVIVSVATMQDITSKTFFVYPSSFDLSPYQLIFQDATVPRAFLVSFLVTLFGVALNMFSSVTSAYALSKKTLPGRRQIMMAIIFTMYFSGGMIPFYLVCKGLGLRNTLFAMILPVAINTFYLIIMRNYFGSLPESLEESAKLDGANDFTILLRIILPISMPILATMMLFYSVDRWNEYFNAILLISKPELNPLQVVLRNMIVSLDMTISSSIAQQLARRSVSIYPASFRMAVIVITSIPIICVYPFMQKHFVKGMLVGSVKA